MEYETIFKKKFNLNLFIFDDKKLNFFYCFNNNYLIYTEEKEIDHITIENYKDKNNKKNFILINNNLLLKIKNLICNDFFIYVLTDKNCVYYLDFNNNNFILNESKYFKNKNIKNIDCNNKITCFIDEKNILYLWGDFYNKNLNKNYSIENPKILNILEKNKFIIKFLCNEFSIVFLLNDYKIYYLYKINEKNNKSEKINKLNFNKKIIDFIISKNYIVFYTEEKNKLFIFNEIKNIFEININNFNFIQSFSIENIIFLKNNIEKYNIIDINKNFIQEFDFNNNEYQILISNFFISNIFILKKILIDINNNNNNNNNEKIIFKSKNNNNIKIKENNFSSSEINYNFESNEEENSYKNNINNNIENNVENNQNKLKNSKSTLNLSKRSIDIGNNKSILIRSNLNYYDDHCESFLSLYNLLNKTNKKINNNNYNNNNYNTKISIIKPQKTNVNLILKNKNFNKNKYKNNNINYFRNNSNKLNDNHTNFYKIQNNKDYERFKDFSSKDSIRYSNFYNKLNSNNISNLKPVNSKDLLIKNYERLFNNNNNNQIQLRNNNILNKSKSYSFLNFPSTNSKKIKNKNNELLYNQSFNSLFSTKIY